MKLNNIFKNKKTILIISIIIIYIFIFSLQSRVPMLGYDDFILNCSHGKSLSYLFGEIFNSIKFWSARSSQIIGYLIGYLPRYIFWIFNSFIIILFIYLVYYYCFSEHKEKQYKYRNIILTFSVVIAYIFYLFPATFDVFFWMPGACNHLFSVVITLIFLIPYYKFLYDKNVFKYKNKIGIILYMIIIGFISGSSLENISIFGLLFMIYTFVKSVKDKKVFGWQISGFISYVAGIAFLLLTASTKYRSIKFLKGTYIIQTGIKKILYVLEYFFVENKYILFALLALLIIFIIYTKIKKIQFDKNFKNILLLFIFSLFTIFIFYFVPYYSNRAILLFSFVSMVLFIYIVSSLIIDKKIIISIIILTLSALNIYGYKYFFDVYKLANEAVTIRNKDIVKQSHLKTKKINFDTISCSYETRIIEFKEYVSEDNFYDNNNYDDSAMKKYYTINSNVKFNYRRNYQYSDYCTTNNPMFGVVGFEGYKVKDKYEGEGRMYYENKKYSKK